MSSKLILATLAAALTSPALAAEPQIITIKTLQAQMRYDLTEFTVSPGAEVKIILANVDDMPHNLVLFQAGTDVVAVSNKNLEQPEAALKRDWLPEDPRMLAHSKMVNPKTKDEIVFKAPEKPGTYPYVCTFPGHAVQMQGKMKVSAPGPGLTTLKFALYLGDWKTLPDFAALKPHREGEIADKLIQLKFDDYKNQFGVVCASEAGATRVQVPPLAIRLFTSASRWSHCQPRGWGVSRPPMNRQAAMKMNHRGGGVRDKWWQENGRAIQ